VKTPFEKSISLSTVLWTVSLALVIGPLYYVYDVLPEVIPVHFTIDGTPDRYGNKVTFVLFMLLTLGLLNGMCLVFKCFMPRLPVGLINWPNKAWWLENDNRRKIFYQRIGWMMVGNAVGINLIFSLVIVMTFSHSLPQEHPLRLEFATGSGMFIGILASLALYSLMLIRRPKHLMS